MVAIPGVFRKTLAIVESEARALRDEQRLVWGPGRCHPWLVSKGPRSVQSVCLPQKWACASHLPPDAPSVLPKFPSLGPWSSPKVGLSGLQASRVREQEGKGQGGRGGEAGPSMQPGATNVGLSLGSGQEVASCRSGPVWTGDIQSTSELWRLLLSPFLHFEKSQQNPYFHKHFFWL